MSKPLMTGNIWFLIEDEVKHFNVQTIPSNNLKGYTLQIDLSYPHELHNLHNDYPLTSIHKNVVDDELSPDSSVLWQTFNPGSNSQINSDFGKQTKLYSSLRNFEIELKTGNASWQDSQNYRVWPKSMVKTIHRFQCQEMIVSKERFRERLLQTCVQQVW